MYAQCFTIVVRLIWHDSHLSSFHALDRLKRTTDAVPGGRDDACSPDHRRDRNQHPEKLFPCKADRAILLRISVIEDARKSYIPLGIDVGIDFLQNAASLFRASGLFASASSWW